MSDDVYSMVAETLDRNNALSDELARVKRELSSAHDEIEKLGKERDTATEEKASRDSFAGSYHLDALEQLLRGRQEFYRENEANKELLKEAEKVLEAAKAAVAKLDEIGVGVGDAFERLSDKFGLFLIELGFDRRPISPLPDLNLEAFVQELARAADHCDNLTDYPSDWQEAIEEFEESKEASK